jgi:lactoylglutathione lyase
MTVERHDYKISFIEDLDGYGVELVERGTMRVGDLIQ